MARRGASPGLLLLAASVVTGAAAVSRVARAEPASGAGATSDADGTFEYVVQPGDTCMAIAVRVLGDRAAYRRIHELNPQLGKLPHDLVPGSVLRLPGKDAPRGPDAVLSRTRGDVKVRRPGDDGWDPAERGMDLFRAWRVGAAVSAAAELTFRDRAKLRLRERTIVILYGPQKATAKVIAARAELEEGTLEARLDELGGQKVAVDTPGAAAEVGEGRAVVAVDGAGTSIVANHDGAAIAVRGRKGGKATGKAVKVKAGMGSRVKKGKAPEPPRPLPPAPVLDGAGGEVVLALGADAAPLAIAWGEVAAAARYRVAVEDGGGEPVLAVEVPAPATGVTTAALPAGRYHVEVSAIDGDGFESRASAPGALEVVAVAVIAPGADAPAPLAGAPGEAPVVALGAELVAPAGGTCAVGDDAGARVRLDDAGVAEATCTLADGRRSAPAALAVAPVTAAVTGAAPGAAARLPRGAAAVIVVELASAGAIGEALAVRAPDGVLVERVVVTGARLELHVRATAAAPARGTLAITAGPATIASVAIEVDEAVRVEPAAGGGVVGAPGVAARAPRAAAAARWELGGFGGAHALAPEVADALGDPLDADHRVTSGPVFGLRLARRLGAPWIVEGELGAIPTLLDNAAGFAGVVTAQVHVGVAIDDGATGARLLVGPGVLALAVAPDGTLREAETFLGWGAAVTRRVGDGVVVRLDARDQLYVAPRGVAHDVEVTLGVGFDLGGAGSGR